MDRIPAAPYLLRLERLDSALRNSRLQRGLVELLTVLDGPLHDTRAQRRADREAKRDFWAMLSERDEITARPELANWVARLQRGMLQRAAQGNDEWQLMEAALAIVQRLPSESVRLQVLAADATGDPHALDPGTPLSTLVLSALAALSERPFPASANDRRSLWAWAGVSVDTLSSSVLLLGLAPSSEGLVAESMRNHAVASEPMRITLRQIQRAKLEWSGKERVFLCENPSVLESAADSQRLALHPVICTEGMISTAADALLRSLAEEGVELHFHGDYDWGGIRIGNLLTQRFNARPSGYGACEYDEAVGALLRKSELAGRRVEASWDPALARAMQRSGVVVYEEQLVATLLNAWRR